MLACQQRFHPTTPLQGASTLQIALLGGSTEILCSAVVGSLVGAKFAKKSN